MSSSAANSESGLRHQLSAGQMTMVAVCGSIGTQNVITWQAVVASCFDFSGQRNKVVYSDFNFPSVMYFWEAQRPCGARVHMVKTDDGIPVPTESLLDGIDDADAARAKLARHLSQLVHQRRKGHRRKSTQSRRRGRNSQGATGGDANEKRLAGFRKPILRPTASTRALPSNRY